MNTVDKKEFRLTRQGSGVPRAQQLLDDNDQVMNFYEKHYGDVDHTSANASRFRRRRTPRLILNLTKRDILKFIQENEGEIKNQSSLDLIRALQLLMSFKLKWLIRTRNIRRHYRVKCSAEISTWTWQWPW